MSEQLQFTVPTYATIVKLQETTSGDYCYVAFHPELPNVISQGDTAAEAQDNLVEATELTITHLVLNGLSIPDPKPLEFAFSNLSVVEPIFFNSSSFSSTSSSAAHHKSNQQAITVPTGQMVTL